MTDAMRREFEEWYLKHAKLKSGSNFSAESIAALRQGDSYAPDCSYLIALWEAWQAARTVPDEAVSILADVIRELENGFVRCETCGDQEDTATLDCMDELRRVHYMLSAAPEGKK